VKLVDEAGKTLSQDAKSLLALKELNTVVVEGRIHREGDRLSLVASGIFVKKK
jgi:hypothetical protein